MFKLSSIDIEQSQNIYKELDRFTKELRKRFLVSEIYLYGSFATGEIHEGSDIDLVIVGDFKGKIFDRIAEVTRLTDLPIEPLVYTEGEFKQMIRTNSFLKKIIKEGKRL